MMIYTLPQIAARNAERCPERQSFSFLDERLTMGAFFEKVHRLAAVLAAQGAERHDRIGIWMHKSLESMAAAYAAMHAGGAYVPLDPASPPERIRRIIRDCGIRILITHPPRRRGLSLLLEGVDGLDAIIGVDPSPDIAIQTIPWKEVDGASTAGFTPPKITGQDLAYIIYTSGSTGEPKGIMHTHASGLAYARLARETYELQPDDRLANFAPLHFDQSTFELFAGPLAGASTVVIPEMHMKLPASLTKLAEDERITIWYSVPYALIQMLLRGVLEERDLTALRWVLYGGEPFPPKHLYALMAQWPHARFSNVYGPAEVNQCTYYHVPGDPADPEAPIPIGRIWDNTEALIVDTAGKPVISGEAGELLVRSQTMMAGYWGRPDLNDQAFYRSMEVPGLEKVFYRTGDLVRERPDGVLEFLGRMDRQVKARGFRIELDEVESALLRNPDVVEAAAYTIPGPDGALDIAAAVITRQGWDGSRETLRSYLSATLPSYALPSRIDLQEDFPRTTSGKIDRRLLEQRAAAAVPLE